MAGYRELRRVKRWDVFELCFAGPRHGNPFVEVSFGARFRRGHREIWVDGFYDGDGQYKVRFMPDTVGEWAYVTESNCPELAGHAGRFFCTEPSPESHGPVRVRGRYHFAYEDGTPYYEVGTTCYAWIHQGDELEEQTLRTLAEAPFNKLRMCIFPKSYTYNTNEPPLFPFERESDGTFCWTRFNPTFFQYLELRIAQLRDLGVEADLILFHPYDRWGFSRMPLEADERYLSYVVARLAAFRNIWWSMANEYDLMTTKRMSDWDHLFRILQEKDPYQHLRSVHNCRAFYDHAKPWITHVSVQHQYVEKVAEWRELYGKPVVVDECKYEGNIPERWGSIPAQELVRKFWEATVQGGYCGHGETYLHPEDILWWSKGGVLHGQSPERIAFLRRILEQGPPCGYDPVAGVVRSGFPCATKEGRYYLTYMGIQQPASVPFQLAEGDVYEADIIDTWEMRLETLPGWFTGTFSVPLPSKPYMAVRLRKLDS